MSCPQESVEEQFRGTVGGMQDSLNSISETTKFLLVIILPNEETFGYLVLASVATVLVGMLFYVIYAVRNWRGANLPMDDYSCPESDFGSFLEECDSDSSSDYFREESLESASLLESMHDPKKEVDFEQFVYPFCH